MTTSIDAGLRVVLNTSSLMAIDCFSGAVNEFDDDRENFPRPGL